MDNIVSFSMKPSDTEARKQVNKLKKHCEKTGISFSYLVLTAIKNLNKELKL